MKNQTAQIGIYEIAGVWCLNMSFRLEWLTHVLELSISNFSGNCWIYSFFSTSGWSHFQCSTSTSVYLFNEPNTIKHDVSDLFCWRGLILGSLELILISLSVNWLMLQTLKTSNTATMTKKYHKTSFALVSSSNRIHTLAPLTLYFDPLGSAIKPETYWISHKSLTTFPTPW